MKKFKIEDINGVIAAMISLFDEDEAVDTGRTCALVDFLLARGVNGLYLTGSTGEGFLMTGSERCLVVDTVVRQVAGRVPVIVHIGDIGTKKTIQLAEHAYYAGADAVSSVPPFYWKFNEEDIYNYYKDVSEATPLPMIVYNVPMAGLMGTELLLKLSKLPRVQGIKFTGKDHDQMGHLIELVKPDIKVYSGCDEMALSGLLAGADGIIGSFYNVMPELFIKMTNAVNQNDLQTAKRLQKIGTEIILEAVSYDYLALMRNMIRWQGVDAGFSRRPFCNYDDAGLELFKQKMCKIRFDYQVSSEEVNFMQFI